LIKKGREKKETMLPGLTYLAIKYSDFKRAGQIRNSLFKKGLFISMPDSLIASQAKDYKITLVTLDSFFIKGGEIIGFHLENPKIN